MFVFAHVCFRSCLFFKNNNRDWVFQAVDFTAWTSEQFKKLNVTGAHFWGIKKRLRKHTNTYTCTYTYTFSVGCVFPVGIRAKYVRDKDAEVLDLPGEFPFRAFRAFMYKQDELLANDAKIYAHYLAHTDLKTKMAQSIHDHCMLDALNDYIDNRAVVGVMVRKEKKKKKKEDEREKDRK